MEGVKAEEKACEEGGDRYFPLGFGAQVVGSQGQESLDEPEDQVGIEAMEEDVVQVIGPGLEPGDPEIHRQGKPCQGYPETHPQVLEQGQDGMGIQVADGQVELNIFGVVPIDEGEIDDRYIDKKGEEDGR